MNIFARMTFICAFIVCLTAGSLVSARGKISKDVSFASKVVSVEVLESKEVIEGIKLNECGDGLVDTNGADDVFGTFDDEQCDDGNIVSGDGCSSACLVEVNECIELSDINFDFNQDGFSDVADIIVAQNIILGRTSWTNDGSCDDRFVSIGLADEGVCCPEGVICDLSCNGRLSSHDLVLMTRVVLGVFEGDICGVEVCEEVDDEGSIDVTGIQISDVSAHACADNVDAVNFEVENTGDIDVVIDEAKFQAYVDTGTFDIMDYVSVARLRGRTGQGYQLLDTVPSNMFDGQMIVFNGFSYTVGSEEYEVFLMTVDGVDELSSYWIPLRFSLVGMNVNTVGGSSVCTLDQLGCAEADSMRTLYFTPNPELHISVDLDDPLTSHSKYVLGGDSIADSPYVASFELRPFGGEVEIEDLKLLVQGDTDGFEQSGSEVILYNQDFDVIGSEYVIDGSEIIFNNINYTLENGIENIYVKVLAEEIGENQDGQTTNDLAFSLVVNEALILECDDQQVGTTMYDGSGQSLPSHVFAIVPVTFANYQFVTSTPLEEYEVDFLVTNGVNEVFAILEVTASERENTSVIDGSDIEILIDSIGFSNVNPQYNSNRRTIRLGSSNILEPIKSGETAYFILLGDVTIPDGESTVMAVEYDAINNPIEYRVSDGTFFSSETRLGIGNISAPEITLLGD